MYSYVIMNIVFMIFALLLVLRLKTTLNRRAILLSSSILFGCMLVFNTYLTALPIVRYNSERILGWRLGTIPFEDFAYLIVAIVLVPSIFAYLKKRTPHTS